MSAVATRQRHPSSHTSLRQHVRRAAGRDRNPLCRPLDRAYSRLVSGLALTILAAFVVATVAALVMYRAETHSAQQTTRHRHTVTALTTGSAVSDDARSGSAWAHARWTYPAGPGAGSIQVPEGTLVGTAVPVGLNDAGYPVGAPKGTEEILSDAVLVGLGTVAVLGLGAEGAFALRRHQLDRRAEAGWESAWEQVEPRWSGRR
ncbi:hypothetical protein F7Q99_34340 [Streptomyces kaniharaensis]|uniref:Uncharacterized protein n=1 Tax=Streptomyces kaniharaensis TaxID=212423 RepID=A0A6N7L080_9ACTN|nr:hypothetical protein [Streptomyces kaniharaensis]MQS17130.1 hypothetical protein [Streptomyces kaniharaensis]